MKQAQSRTPKTLPGVKLEDYSFCVVGDGFLVDVISFNECNLPLMSLQSFHAPRPCIVTCIVSRPAGMMCVGDGE